MIGRLTLAQRIQLQIGLVIAFVIVSVTAVGYIQTVSSMRDEALSNLQSSTRTKAILESNSFLEAQQNTEAVRDEYLRRLEANSHKDHTSDFEAWFVRYADGLIRVRPERDYHKHLPSIYIRAPITVDSQLRREVVTAFELMREWGPPQTLRYFSTYIDLPGKSLIMYSPSVNWGKEADKTTNNFDYPPVQNSAPDKNPQRKTLWTDVYFDDKAQTWMVSVITPIDQVRWIGTASQDIAVGDLIRRTTNEYAPGTYNLVMDRRGKLIAHPSLMEKIRRSSGNLDIAALEDPRLSEIFTLAGQDTHDGVVRQTANSDAYIGISRIQGPEWYFVTVYPKALLEQRGLASARAILLAGLAGLVLEITLLAWILRRQVAVPLKALDAATQAVAQGNMSVSIEPRGQAELGLLADRFLGMLDRLRERDASLVRSEATKDALLQELEDRVRSRTLALEQSNAELQTAMKVLRTAQDELLQREKLASLGRMVAGLAHELNTPIGNALTIGTAMADHARMLNNKFLGDELKKSTLAKYLDENVSACAVLERSLVHAAELVANFKQVSADRLSERRRSFDLAHTVEEVLATLRPSFRTTQFQLICRVSPAITMDSYPGLLTQIISNLVINAKLHAFEGRESGVVTIEGGCVGDSVTMTVSDDGHGVEPSIRSRIFDPFFTTRMGRGGTGLGLSIVHSLVANGLGGSIRMEPAPVCGTRFIMTFPSIAPQQDSGSPELDAQ